jgi:hypothetical protein
MPRHPSPRSAGEWATVLPVYLGMLIVAASFVLYALTDRVSPAMLSAAGTLIAIGQGTDAVVALRKAARGEPLPSELEQEKESREAR